MIVRYLEINTIGSFIDKARDMLIAKNRKSIFFSLTEQSAVVEVKFSEKINLIESQDIFCTAIH